MSAISRKYRQDSNNRLARALQMLVLGLFVVIVLGAVFYTRMGTHTRVYAADATNLNFQARLQSAAGAVVADGTYSITFNLYSASSGGTTQWTETQSVATRAGYLSVYLGSVTPFTSTIDWSQEQWLTMNVNGDGEMTPRLKLTATPFSLRSGSAANVNSSATNGPSANSNDVAIQTGNATGTTSNSGNISIDTGTATGTTGTISIAGANASGLTLGRAGLQTTIGGNALVQGGTLTLGTTSQAGSLVISDGSSNTVTLTASSIGTNYNLTMPTNAPSTDQCLRTDVTTASQLTFGTCGNRKVQQTYDTYSINQAANATTVQRYIVPTTNTAFSINVAGADTIRMSRAGSFRSCSILSSAAVTAGTVNVRFRKNGVDSGTNYCTLNTTLNRSNNQDLDPGIETFNAGDSIGIALVSVGLAPTTLEHWVSFTVEYGTGSDSGIYSMQDAYNNSSATEVSLDNTRGGLTVRDNAAPITGNLLEVQNSTGATTYLSVSTTGVVSANNLTVQNGGITVTGNSTITGTLTGLTGLTVASGGASITGGLNNNTGGITNAGSITGVGTNITATAGLTIASGGAGVLTLDSATGTIALAGTDSVLQRTAAGTFSFDLNDAANTTLSLTNTGAGLAGLDVEGGITAGNGNAFSVNADGDITSNFSVLNGTSTANGAGVGSTNLILINAANFDVGNYVQVNSANCGGAGVNPCYAKITAKAVNTLTITPALSWGNGSTVNEYHIPEIGGINTSQALANRFGRGYFISGVATGNGTTFYEEDSISSSLSTFNLLNSGVTTLNIGSAATSLTLGSGGTTVSVSGTLSGNGSGLTNISAASISSGTVSDSNLSSNVALLSGVQSFSGAKTFTAGLTITAGQSLTIGGESFSDLIGTNLTNSAGVLSLINNPAFTTSVTSPIFTSTGALTLSSAAGGDINIDSSSNVITVAGTDTTLRRTAAGSTNIELNDAGATTLVLNNTAAGAANLNLFDGALQTAGTTRITNGGALQNVTGDTGILTSGTLGTARGGTGVNASTATNGQLLIGNGTGFSLAGLANNGGVTITNGAGTIGLAVAYGSSANTAVQGNNTLICPSGSGNLTGGGTTLTLGTSGGTCGAITTNNAVSFSTSVTSPIFTSTGGLTLSSAGAGDITFDSSSNIINIAGTDTTLRRIAAGNTNIELNDAANTALVLNNTGTGSASLNLSDGGLQVAGTSVLSNTRALSNLTGLSSSGTVQLSSLTAGLVRSDATGNLSIAVAGTDYENPLTFTSGLTRTTNTVRLGGNLGQTTDIGLNGNALTITGSGSSVFTAFAAGGIDIRNDGTAALAVRNAAGTRSLFTVNTTGNLVQVGSTTTDATAILSVLDYYNTATDPGGTNGGSYYNTATNRMRCFEDTVWKDCISDTKAQKTANQNGTADNNTFVSDTDLRFATIANSFYTFDAVINFSATNTSSDLKYTITVPAGATLYVSTSASTGAATTTDCNITAGAQVCNVAILANGFRGIIELHGYVATAATAGNVQLQYSIQTNTGTVGENVTVYRGSSINWRKTQ